MNTTTLTDNDTYNAAADALTDGNLDVYEAIKAAAPALDWSGHDRRAARLCGLNLVPDPALAQYSMPDPCGVKLVAIRPVLPRRDISRCKSCKAPIWYHGTPPHPFDVVDGRGSEISHFTTCPDAHKYRNKKHHQNQDEMATTTTSGARRAKGRKSAA